MSLQRMRQMAAVLLGCSLAAPVLAQSRPNLIFILTDDQGVDAIQWPVEPVDEEMVTPTLYALASQGVSFKNCRVNPNCSPTRGCLMTGRSALDTGVCGVLGRYSGDNPCTGGDLSGYVAQVTNRLSLQTHEKTIAEVLKYLDEDGYYTILIDKWHLGYNQAEEELGLRADEQGFDEYFDWKEIVCDGYGTTDPYYYADIHMLAMLDNAITAVGHAGEGQPYALFYHTITPHGRHEDDSYPNHMSWRQISPENEDAMIPVSKALDNQQGYPTNRMRFIQNIEAIDTTIQWLLIGLGVIDDDEGRSYQPASNTVVFFSSDNGTDTRIAGAKAKNSLYERGIHVPLFVMGEGITGTAFADTIDDRPVTHVDMFETICDIVEASPSERGNAIGAFPRRGVTFADAINWGDPPPAPREYVLSSLEVSDDGPQTWQVAITWGDEWKLICSSGGAGFSNMHGDEFYNLHDDSSENNNLLAGTMSVDAATMYLKMRDRLVDEWPTAVSVALPAEPAEFQVEQYAYLSPNTYYVLVVTVENEDGEMTYAGDEFYDQDHICDLNICGMSQWEENLRDSLRAQMMDAVSDGTAAPDVRLVDIPLSSSIVVKDDLNIVPAAALTVGFQGANGESEVEFRARLNFNFSAEFELPPGFVAGDLVDAQVIVFFGQDSALFDPNDPDDDYLADDRDTDVITLHKMVNSSNDLWDTDNYDATPLGQFEPPPHIIAIPFDELPAAKVRVSPMPEGTPVSFGHNAALLSAVSGWLDSETHYGIMLKTNKLLYPYVSPGNQGVNFLREAVLRLTFDRTE